MRRIWIAGAAVLVVLVLFSIGWFNRFQYSHLGNTTVRTNRFTDSTDKLTSFGWQHIEVLDLSAGLVPKDSSGSLQNTTPPPDPIGSLPIPKGFARVIWSTDIFKLCTFDAAPCGRKVDIGSNVGYIATVKAGDLVQVESENIRTAIGSDIYKAKFHQWVGYVSASQIELGNNSETPAQ